MACPLAAMKNERIWTEKPQYEQAEQKYYEHLSKLLKGSTKQEHQQQFNDTAADAIVKSNVIDTAEEVTENNQMKENDTVVVQPIKSPSKKNRKSKKEKKEAQAAAAAAAAITEQNVKIEEKPCQSNEDIQTALPKTKNKKEKTNRSKQLSKQSTVESLKSNDESVSLTITEAEKIVTDGPVGAAATVVTKPKKNKKKDKKLQNSKDENVCSASEDASVISQAKQKPTTETKEKKTKNGNDKKNKQQQQVLQQQQQEQQPDKDYSQCCKTVSTGGECTLVTEIAKARQHIKSSLERMDGIAALASTPGKDVLDRLANLEKENGSLRSIIQSLRETSLSTEKRIKDLEQRLQSLSVDGTKSTVAQAPAAAPAAAAKKDDDDDDGVDLFGSDSEDEDDAAAKVREQRLAEYAAKKSKKPTLIAKSNVILDIKPWDDETDMKQMEVEVRKIVIDGLLWGAAKLVPLAFGIHKLQIATVIEDEKVSVDLLIEEIEKLEDLVQSVDVAAFNKI